MTTIERTPATTAADQALGALQQTAVPILEAHIRAGLFEVQRKAIKDRRVVGRLEDWLLLGSAAPHIAATLATAITNGIHEAMRSHLDEVNLSAGPRTNLTLNAFEDIVRDALDFAIERTVDETEAA